VVSIVLGNSTLETDEIGFYPNPGSGDIQWKGVDGKAEIKVFSTDGKIMVQQEIEGNEKMNLGGLAKGFYFIHFKTREVQKVEKLILK